MIHPTNPTAVRVKRDGPRGWHWRLAENYDPAVDELYVDPAAPEPAPEPEPVTAPAPRKPGRPRKGA
jgi:hypothetical protein